ncbi:MAG: hypothetical protein GX989_01495 [Firmicutes bacterium]|nr:hypothetical protein [Bacillota bacterium]
MFVQLLLLCAAVSMDGLGAGFSYGARNLKIPFLSLVIISLSSSLTMGLAMFLGWTFKHFVSLLLARFLGGIILVFLGSWIVWQGLGREQKEIFLNWGGRHRYKIEDYGHSIPFEQKPGQIINPGSNPAGTGKLNYLRFLLKIIFSPQEADLDRSGVINLGEAVLLGFALACDAFGAGFAVALAGFNPWLTSGMVGLSKFILISFGLWGGCYYRDKLNALPAHLFSGGLLIFLGLLNILWGGF